MKRLILSIVIIWLSTNLYAQSPLEGSITNIDKEPLADAYVFIPELKLATVSDLEGRFKFNNIPKGKFLIAVTYQGYESASKNISNPLNESLSFALIPSTREIEEVVILGLDYKDVSQNTYPISTLDSKKIQSDGNINLTEALGKLPGVAVFSNGPGLPKPVLHGLTGSRISIVNNGFATNQQQWQNEHGMLLFSAGVDRVQVIKGPASLLYGEGAFGGIVQLIPEKEAPMGKVIGDVNAAMFSNTIGLNTDFGIKSTKEKVSWIVRAGAQSHGDYYSGDGKRAPNTRNAAYLFQGTVNLHRKSGLTSVNYNYTNSTSGIIEAQELLVPEQETRFEREFEGPHHVVQLHNIGVKNSFFIGKGKLNINVNAQLNNRQEIEGTEINAVDISNLVVQSNTFIEQATYTQTLGSASQITLGVEGKQQNFENRGERYLIPDASLSTFSGYAVTEWQLGDWQWQAGLRYDHKEVKTEARGVIDTLNYFEAFDKPFDQWNGNIGTSWAVTDHVTARFNAGAGSRVPNLSELASNGIHEGTTRYEIGDKNLEYEQNVQYDVALELSYPNFGLLVNAYYNDIQNFIYLENGNEAYYQFTKYNFKQADATFKGVDVALDWGLGKNLQLNHGFSAVVAETADGKDLPFIPAFSLINTAKIHLPIQGKFENTMLEITGRHYMKQDRVAAEETTTDGYTLLDIGLNANIKMGAKTVRWSLKASNLLNEKYFNHLSFIRNLGVPNMGRNVALSAHIPINFN